MLDACRVVLAMTFIGTLAVADAGAQGYPTRPIRVITAEPGGGNDFAARTIGQAISPRLGQQWVIDNRGGAGGQVGVPVIEPIPEAVSYVADALNSRQKRDAPFGSS